MAESVLATETLTIQEENPSFESDSIPSDVLVQRQLQDIILTQKSAIERLSDDVCPVCLLFEFPQSFVDLVANRYFFRFKCI